MDQLFGSQGEGSTPVHPDDLIGLRLGWIATQGDIDEVERINVQAGLDWAVASRREFEQVLDDEFVRELHRRMFGDVWAWAGHYRTRELSIGIDWVGVPTAVRDLVGDATYWFDARDDSAGIASALARFHHRLVHVHPFPNGNGRAARLVTDELARSLDVPYLSWGARQSEAGVTIPLMRSQYLTALRAIDADPDDLQPLVDFMRS
jgi:Fic-DOC domain mobile mystery protein B